MKQTPLIVLLVVTATLSFVADRLAGPLAIDLFGIRAIAIPIGKLVLFGAAMLLFLVVDAILVAGAFVRSESGRFDARAALRALKMPTVTSALLVVVASVGVVSSANLAEVYRVSATQWHDDLLWRIDRDIVPAMLASSLNAPIFWDAVYQSLWLTLFVALGGLAKAGRTRAVAEALCAVVLAFHLTRYLAILAPTAGPLFARPELFDIAGTGSAAMAQLLRDYMSGRAEQFGLFPGTQAMPSLHVGLAWCALVVSAREWRWTLWLSVPWFALNWLSTVFLGWHYTLDGVGGVLVMSASLWTARTLLQAADTLAEVANREGGSGHVASLRRRKPGSRPFGQ